jgi:hypothetical protein
VVARLPIAARTRTPPHTQRGFLVALLAEKDARLSEKDARLADKDRELIARLSDKELLLAEKALRHSVELAAALHATAVAEGRLSVRSILQDSVASAWAVNRPAGAVATGVNARIAALLESCSGFTAYLRVAATDNRVDPTGVLAEARKLYATLCSRAHGDAPGGSASLTSAIFESSGNTALVAFAAIVHFSGRRLALYDKDRIGLKLVMRTERGGSATEAAIRASPLLVEGGGEGAATTFAFGKESGADDDNDE